MTTTTKRAQIERSWQQGINVRLPHVADCCEDFIRDAAAVGAGDYQLTEAARTRQLEAVKAQFEARYRDAVEAACFAATEPIDREIAELKEQDDRDLRNPATQTQELRASRLARQVSESSAAGITSALDEALHSGSELVIRAVWSAGKKRHAELRDTVKLIPSRADAAAAAATAFSLASAQWELTHPPATKQLADLGKRRENAIGEVVRSAAFTRQLFGIG
jgi:hypothetical protein